MTVVDLFTGGGSVSDDRLLPRPTAADWRTIAACRDADTALFFTPERTLEALAFCDQCPVRRECDTAGRHEEGVWGGRPEGQRHGRYTRPGQRVGTPVTIVCAECGRDFVRVTQVGIRPVVCGPRCRKDRDLRNARRARARRMAS